MGNKYQVFRTKHPRWHVVNALLSMFLPFCLVALTAFILKVDDSRVILAIYAMFGSFVLGGGLLLCVATDYDKEVFWRLNIYPISIGALITLGNLFCACSTIFDGSFDSRLLHYQLCCYLSVFWCLLLYGLGREHIEDMLLRKTCLNAGQMDKKKKGFFNYLWYRKIHREVGIGWLYYFNAILTMSILLSLIGVSILVLHKSIPKIVMPLPILTAAGTIILELFVLVNTVKNKKKYFRTNKKSFLRKIPYFYEVGSIASVVLFTWLQIKAFLAL
jgi:hypothetical protein